MLGFKSDDKLKPFMISLEIIKNTLFALLDFYYGPDIELTKNNHTKNYNQYDINFFICF